MRQRQLIISSTHGADFRSLMPPNPAYRSTIASGNRDPFAWNRAFAKECEGGNIAAGLEHLIERREGENVKGHRNGVQLCHPG